MDSFVKHRLLRYLNRSCFNRSYCNRLDMLCLNRLCVNWPGLCMSVLVSSVHSIGSIMRCDFRLLNQRRDELLICYRFVLRSPRLMLGNCRQCLVVVRLTR